MKPTIFTESRILNLKSKFKEKGLCDGVTFSSGSSCAYSCAFCYVESMRITAKDLPEGLSHMDVLVRRKNPVDKIDSELMGPNGVIRFHDPNDTRVVFASPLVDVAANMELMRETAAICRKILQLTHWQIRLLSKSNLLPHIANILGESEDAHKRIIYGVSTGTLDNSLAKSFEAGTPLVSKRIESLHWLQDHGFRTYGMICPSLPQEDYAKFSKEICDAIRIDKCEHVWAEVINVRGSSLTATTACLRKGGFEKEAKALENVSHSKEKWEAYNQATFLGHTANIPPEKLKYLTYTTKESLPWWETQRTKGAVLLGKAAEATQL